MEKLLQKYEMAFVNNLITEKEKLPTYSSWRGWIILEYFRLTVLYILG